MGVHTPMIAAHLLWASVGIFGDRQGVHRTIADPYYMDTNNATALHPDAERGGRGSKPAAFNIVTAVSLELVSMANNWIMSLAQAEATITVYALDSGVCARLSTNATCIESSNTRHVKKQVTEMHKNVVYQAENYLRNVNKKLAAYIDALDRVPGGSWVLFSDVDIAFLKPPQQYLASHMPRDANFMFQQGLKTCNDAPGNVYAASTEVCTGLFYARNVKAVRVLLRQAIGSPSYDHTDQGAVNHVLRKQNVAFRLLPCALFPNGYVFQHNQPKDPVAVHFNYIANSADKIALMRKHNMWGHPAPPLGGGGRPVTVI